MNSLQTCTRLTRAISKCISCHQPIKLVSPILQGTSYNFSTSSVHQKKTPATIGVMSWVRSATRRKYLEQKFKDTVKSEEDILKEELLDRSEPVIEFLPSSRIGGKLNEEKMYSHLVKPTVFVSSDKQTIICYHPPPKQLPETFTRRAVGQSLFALDKEVLNSFKSTMTDTEVAEALELREKDPRVWNTNALSKLFEVKPEIVKSRAPLNKFQMQRANAEKEVYQSMSVMKRQQFRALQKWERLQYIRETRDVASSLRYESFEGVKNPKEYTPPRF